MPLGGRTRWLVVGGAVAAGIVVVTAVLALGGFGGAGSTSISLSIVPYQHASISLGASDVFDGPLYELQPSSIDVPANTLVHFTIYNYDPVAHPVPWWSVDVNGTMDDMMIYMGSGGMGGMGGQMTSSLSPSDISHTFTVQSHGYFLNVPIPVALNNATPSMVKFSVLTGASGEFGWNCYGYGMASMSGPYTVH